MTCEVTNTLIMTKPSTDYFNIQTFTKFNEFISIVVYNLVWVVSVVIPGIPICVLIGWQPLVHVQPAACGLH